MRVKELEERERILGGQIMMGHLDAEGMARKMFWLENEMKELTSSNEELKRRESSQKEYIDGLERQVKTMRQALD